MYKTSVPQMYMFLVETEHQITGEHWTYYQEAYSAQKAVDRVRCFCDENEKIIQVAKVIKGWK